MNREVADKPEVDVNITSVATTTLLALVLGTTTSDINGTFAVGINNTSNFDWILEEAKEAKIALSFPALLYIIILIVTGMLGNSVVLYVYWRNWTSSTARVFILSLAIIDITNCLITLPMELVIMYNPVMFDYPGLCKLFRFTTYTMNSSSACVLVAIGCDVCHRIKKPMRQHMTTRRAKLVCLICIIVGVAVAWPSLIIYGIDRKEIITPNGNATSMPCLFDLEMKYTPFPKIFFGFLFFSTVLVLIGICALYGIIGFSLYRQSSRWTRTGSSRSWSSNSNDTAKPPVLDKNFNEEKEIFEKSNEKAGTLSRKNSKISLSRSSSIRSITSTFLNRTLSRKSFKIKFPKYSGGKKTTQMLFVIAVIYVISFLPFMILATMRALQPGLEDTLEPSSQMVYQVVIRSYLINSAINPIVYSFCNNRFRHKCRVIFLSMIGKKSTK